MSKCAVHMMKMKMSALGGIQSHNQREHESRKNKEIDYKKSEENFDTVNGGDIDYQRAVKERIAELDLKKAVRKDAVVYCSFIVSSDRGFFERLGERVHRQRELSREGYFAYADQTVPFEYCSEDYRTECIREGSEKFFNEATAFFQKRYGAENVINGTVHLDEYTPHMHLGIVPVTSDGRLSAKEIFTPLELKQLQTDFAEKVGERFNLKRGKEGSEATHLDELSFKIQKRQEQLERLEEEVSGMERKERFLRADCKDLEKHVESLNKTISDLNTDISTLDTQKRFLEGLIERIRGALEKIAESFKKAEEMLKTKGGAVALAELRNARSLEFIEKNGMGEAFDKYCQEQDDLLKEIEVVTTAKPFANPFVQEAETGIDFMERE